MENSRRTKVNLSGPKEKANAAYRVVPGIACFLAAVLLGIVLCPLRAAAYFGVDEDYLLRTQKPEGRGESPYHYLEFVSGDADRYTVQEGDTLWGIARKYYGSGAAYQKLWEENADRIETPETMQIGTGLELDKRFYVNVGMQDFIRDDVMHQRNMSGPDAWEWEPESYPYQIFSLMTYRNDLGEKDPFSQWEAFQKEVTDCGRRLCGDRISDLSFERYHVTDVCDLCSYQFVFDGGSGKYLIMAVLVYTGEIENEVFTNQNGWGQILPISHQYMKNEVFAVCDLDRCTEADLEEAKGKAFYMAARTIDSGVYLPKMADNVGADDWNYPELHNPFIQAMRSLRDEPHARVESSLGKKNDGGQVGGQQGVTDLVNSKGREIQWKDPVLEQLVRDQLARLWLLTDEERVAFGKRQMTDADLAGVESLALYEDRNQKVVLLQLCGYEETRTAILFDEENSSGLGQSVLTTLDDLSNFTGLRRLDIHLNGSDITDFSALGELAGLRELCMDMESARKKIKNRDLAFLGKLKNLRLLYLYGWDREGGSWSNSEPTCSLEEITDLSVLKNCKQLAYLKLTTGNVENYDFLGELPEIYYIDLDGRDGMRNVEPDTSLMPKACFIEYYGEQVRFDCGGSREIKDDDV